MKGLAVLNWCNDEIVRSGRKERAWVWLSSQFTLEQIVNDLKSKGNVCCSPDEKSETTNSEPNAAKHFGQDLMSLLMHRTQTT